MPIENRNNLKFAVRAALALSLVAGPALATAATITVYPGDNVTDTTDPVGVPGDSAPGFGTGSFKANGSAKTANIFSADQLFGTGSTVTIGDLKSFSYWTKQDVPDTGTPVNWYVEIYTVADGTDDDGWYGRRLNLEPYFAENRSEPDNTWVQWSTDGSTNKLRVFDANRGESGDLYGTYTDPFLSDVTGGSINWHDFYTGYVDQSYDYRGEQILAIGISTGSAWANGFTGQLDGFEINWDAGRSAQTTDVNFEARGPVSPVPEPSALAMFGLGLLGLGFLARRRRPERS